jgi:hypothetical protein
VDTSGGVRGSEFLHLFIHSSAGRHLVTGVDKLVHAARAERRAHGLHDGLTRIDVADQLRLALTGVRALLEQDNLRLLLVRRATRSSQSTPSKSINTAALSAREAPARASQTHRENARTIIILARVGTEYETREAEGRGAARVGLRVGPQKILSPQKQPKSSGMAAATEHI